MSRLELLQGTALRRRERHKWISSDWDVSENRHRVHVDSLTASGRKPLARERPNREFLSTAIAGVMRPPTAEAES